MYKDLIDLLYDIKEHLCYTGTDNDMILFYRISKELDILEKESYDKHIDSLMDKIRSKTNGK